MGYRWIPFHGDTIFHQVLETFLNMLGNCQIRLGQNYEIVYFRINPIVSIETLIETGLLLTKESVKDPVFRKFIST